MKTKLKLKRKVSASPGHPTIVCILKFAQPPPWYTMCRISLEGSLLTHKSRAAQLNMLLELCETLF